MPIPEEFKLGRQQRFVSLQLARVAADPDNDADASGDTDNDGDGPLTFSFASEQPVDRWFGSEVLSCDPGMARMGRLNDGAPLLFNHDMGDLLGVVDRAWMGNDKRAYCSVRFSGDERGQWAAARVAEGTLRNVSFAYRVYKFLTDEETDTYTATDWEPLEVSLVTVPADQSVGIGRSVDDVEMPVILEILSRGAPPQPSSAPAETSQPAAAGFILPGEIKMTQATENPAGTEQRTAEQILADERSRISEIEAMCASHSVPAEARAAMIKDGRTIEEARGIVLDMLMQRGDGQRVGQSGGAADGIGLTDQEKRSWSLVRAVNAAVSGDWSKAGFEREVSQTIAKKLGKTELRAGAFMMPTDIPFAAGNEQEAAAMRAFNGQRAAFNTGATGTGGAIVATNLLAEAFIEVLRNVTVVGQLGATYLTGLVGGVDIPRQISAASGYWVAESGAVTESEGTFDKVSLRPKTVGALSKMSRMMMLQSTPAIEMIARQDLLAQLAIAIDAAALYGTGASNQPTGIANTSGIYSVVGGTNGATVSFDHIIQLQAGPIINNAPLANLAFAINGKTWGYLSTLKATTNQYIWSGAGAGEGSPPSLHGDRFVRSNQLRSNLTKGTASGICSELVYGNWSELLIGEWGAIEILANPYDSTGFANGDVLLRAFQTVDIGVRHAASFAYMSDALTTGF